VNGSDVYSGLSWKKAKQTIMAAINLARYLPGTTTIDDTKDHKTLVLIAPGHYNGEDIWFSGYGIDIVGAAHGRPGGDYGVAINYDAAQDTNAVIAFSGSGISLRNLHINVEEAIPGIWCSAGDNNLIENCVIISDGDMTYGMNMASLEGSVIQDCSIRDFATAGIYKDNAGHAIQGGIYRCQIGGENLTAGADGILFDNCVKDGTFVIRDNFIDVRAGGVGSVGISIAGTGTLWVAENHLRVHTTPITHGGDGRTVNYQSTGAALGGGTYAIHAGDA
jgi:hypothetical protein